jgi:hypothetical protein
MTREEALKKAKSRVDKAYEDFVEGRGGERKYFNALKALDNLRAAQQQ